MKILILMLLMVSPAFAKTVRYELTVEKRSVNMSGKKEVDFALMVNGGIPAPTLEFTEGDIAEILIVNKVPEQEVSFHWHGLLLPPLEDGVAYVNTPPIHSGQSRLFRFPIRQHGTYWYHSHTGLQEQKGVYGAFVIQPRKKIVKADREAVAVISDWSDENADQILKNLRKDGDYYLYKKNSKRSYWGALRAGQLGTTLKNEWDRMGGMDLSDVGYDAFLINGKKDNQLVVAHPGEKVRLRVINAGASSYFYLSLAGLPFQVIAADGVDIEPVTSKEILMGMAETYDLLFTIPEHKNFELRATVQDVTGYASAWIGMGTKVPAPDRAPPDLYAPMDHASGSDHLNHSPSPAMQSQTQSKASADHSSHGTPAVDHSKHQASDSHVDHSQHSSHGAVSSAPSGPIVELLTVDNIQAKESTAYSNLPAMDLKLVLGGSMERYVWHINGKAIHEERNLVIHEGQVIRFTMVNDTMMHHPMHLHGHFFRVLNGKGNLSPLKHTVDVPPHGTRTIEFLANEPGEWMLHCHNLYHMKTGMARVVKYSTFVPSAEIQAHQKHDPHLHDHLYFTGMLEGASNQARAKLKVSQTWNELLLNTEAKDHDRHWEVEGDLLFRRWVSQFWHLNGGGTSFGEHQRAMVGVGTTLPLLIEVNAFIDHEADLRLDVEKKFQWTSSVFSETELRLRSHEKPEWGTNLMYGPGWHWAVGVNLNQEKWGVGARWRF